jgi:hypothetical protein
MSELRDPQTLEAIDKIRAILTEYDLWGCVTVSSASRTHWLYHFDPSWSCLHFDPQTGAARIRAKRADFQSAAGQHYVVEQTVGAIFNTRDYAAMLFQHMDKMAELLDKQGLDIEHHPFQDVQYVLPKK